MSTAARTKFGHDTTTDEVLDGLDLRGRRVLVTGGTSGLGAETARALACAGAEVVLTARDLAKGEAVASSIRAALGSKGGAIEVAELELGDLAAIRRAAATILERRDTLDILINNAGVMACPESRTVDGFERQLGTNHLGHFLLTALLVPALRRGNAPRIVNVSSRGHHVAPLDLDDPNFERRAYDPWTAYGQSKTANILHAVELERRLAGAAIHAYALHPGVIQTELMRHLDAEAQAGLMQRIQSGGLRLKSTAAGAATQVYAATAPELAERGGVYLEDCAIAEVEDERFDAGVRSYALDPAIAEQLWALSEQLVGYRLEL